MTEAKHNLCTVWRGSSCLVKGLRHLPFALGCRCLSCDVKSQRDDPCGAIRQAWAAICMCFTEGGGDAFESGRHQCGGSRLVPSHRRRVRQRESRCLKAGCFVVLSQCCHQHQPLDTVCSQRPCSGVRRKTGVDVDPKFSRRCMPRCRRLTGSAGCRGSVRRHSHGALCSNLDRENNLA